MENNIENTKPKGLIVLIVILSIFLCLAVGYICYDKFYTGNSDTTNNENNGNLENDSLVEQEKEISAKVLYVDDKDHLIAKINGEWIQLLETSNHIMYLGIYDNNVYYSDNEGINSINISGNEYKSNLIFDFDKLDDEYNAFNGNSAVIVDEALYFTANSNVYSLNLITHKLDNIFSANEDDYISNMVLKDNILYFYYKEYLENDNDEIETIPHFYSYDLKNKKVEEMTDRNFAEKEFYALNGDDNNLFFFKEGSTKDDFNVYEYVNGEAKFLLNVLGSDVFRASIVRYLDGDIYYINNYGDLYKSSNGKNTLVYDGKYELANFFITDNNILKLHFNNNGSLIMKYVYNDKEITLDEAKKISDVLNVKTKSGNISLSVLDEEFDTVYLKRW